MFHQKRGGGGFQPCRKLWHHFHGLLGIWITNLHIWNNTTATKAENLTFYSKWDVSIYCPPLYIYQNWLLICETASKWHTILLERGITLKRRVDVEMGVTTFLLLYNSVAFTVCLWEGVGRDEVKFHLLYFWFFSLLS